MQKRGYHDFSFKIFCLTVPKNFVGEHFSVSENFVHRKILCMRRGYLKTPLKNLCLTVPIDKIRRRTLLCLKEFRYRKVSSKGGGKLHGFFEKFLISQGRKNFAREPFCVAENFW